MILGDTISGFRPKPEIFFLWVRKKGALRSLPQWVNAHPFVRHSTTEIWDVFFSR